MLDLMRKNTRSLVTYLLFAVIIVVFIFTFNTVTPDQACGGSSGPDGPVRTLAEVGDATVDSALHRLGAVLTVDPPSPNSTTGRALQRELAYRTTRYINLPLRRDYDRYIPEPADVHPVKVVRVLDDLIETALVAGVAKTMGLGTSAREMFERMAPESFFDPDTKEFLSKRWHGFIRNQYRTSPARFEEFAAQELLRDRTIGLLVGGATLPQSELALYHAGFNHKVDLELVTVGEPEAAALVAVSQAEANAWAKDKGAEIEAYYKANESKEYKKPERAEVHGIFVAAPNSALIASTTDAAKKAADEKARTEAKIKAEVILNELLTNNADKEAAKPAPTPLLDKPAEGDDKPAEGDDKPAEGDDKPAEGDDKPAEGDDKPAEGDDKPAEGDDEPAEGDDEPAEGDDEPAEGDDEPADGDDEPGDDADEPVEKKPAPKPEGKEDDPEDKGTPLLAQAEPVAAPAMPDVPGRPTVDVGVFEALAKDKSEHSSSKYAGGKFKERTAKDLDSAPFGKGLSDAVLKLSAGQVSEVIEVPSGFWIIRLDAKLPAFHKTLDQVRDEIAARLLKSEKADAFKKALAEEVLAAAKKDPTQPLEKAAEAVNAKYKAAEGEGLLATTTGMFSQLDERASSGAYGKVPGVGPAKELAQAAFKATKDAPVIGEVHEQDGIYFVARLKDVEEAGELTEEKLEELRGRMGARLDRRKRLFYRGWYEDLKASQEASLSSDWEELKQVAEQNYRETGGVLPGDAPPAPESPEAEAAPKPE